jgi:hypothetical protein
MSPSKESKSKEVRPLTAKEVRNSCAKARSSGAKLSRAWKRCGAQVPKRCSFGLVDKRKH